MIQQRRFSLIAGAVAALGAATLLGPIHSAPAVRSTKPEETPERLSRQRKRWLKRQAQKQQRKHRKHR